VRPRFTDGTFEEPLPLDEHFAELFLSSPTRVSALVIDGPRGSGLTTTLEVLAQAANAAGRKAIFASELATGDPRGALTEIARGAILLADLSVLPLGGRDRGVLRALGARYLRQV